MSLYRDFVQETGQLGIVESEDGFATYKIFPHGECYIVDIYVVPEKRKTDVATRFADEISEIAKVQGCKQLTGTVIPSHRGSTTSLKVLLGYGFTLLRSEVDRIWFMKELN